MTKETKRKDKDIARDFSEIFENFGKAVSEIFNDPKLKEKASDLGRNLSQSAEAFAGRFQDEEVRKKFREVGKAAQDFGKNLADSFKSKRGEDSSKGEQKETKEK